MTMVTAGTRPLLPPPRWRPAKPLRVAGLILMVLLALLVLPPIAILVEGGLTHLDARGGFAAWTLDHYADLLTPDLFMLLRNSIVFALGTTLVSLLFGGILAWLVERTNTPLKTLAYGTTILSLGTPYILYVTAWLFLFGRAGPFNSAYRALTGATEPLFNVYSLGGMILVEGFLWSPLVFLLMASTFRASNADMEEAARMSGASVFDTLTRVTLPMAKPAIVALMLFIFIRNIEAFEVPALVGLPGDVRVLTTDIYLAIRTIPPDLGHASAFSTLLLLAVGVLLHFYGRLSRHAERFHSVTGKGYRPRPFNLGPWRWVGGTVVLFNFTLILVLPFLALVWLASQPYMRPVTLDGFKSLTLQNFRTVWSSSYYLELAGNTLAAAAGATIIVVLLALVASWFAARRKPFGQIIDQLMTMPLIFPGVVLGVAVLQIALMVPFPLYGTLWVITLAFVIRYMPYGMRYAYAGTLQIHKELEEAAIVAGATQVNVLRRVVAPLLSPALLSAALFIFLLGAKELSIAILLASPTTQTMAVAMFDMWTNGQGGELAALGLTWAAIMSIVAALFYAFARLRGHEAYGH